MPKKENIENIQFEYGVVHINYGETGARKLGITRGGTTFDANQVIRDIEHDGAKGKTKGMQIIDEINALLKVATLESSEANLQLAMPYLKKTGDVLGCEAIGPIAGETYLKNVTMFAKVIGGGYRKVTLFNAMNEANFSLAAIPKGEGLINLEIYAHWDTDPDATIKDLFTIETIQTIA